jgi:hypothetical protein
MTCKIHIGVLRSCYLGLLGEAGGYIIAGRRGPESGKIPLVKPGRIEEFQIIAT